MLLDMYLGRHSALDDGKDPGPGFVLYKFPDQESLELYVIGKCQDCKYWGETLEQPEGLPTEVWEDLKDTHRQCENEESPVMVAPKDFGCIHSIKADRRKSQYDEAGKALPDDVESDRRRIRYDYERGK